MCSRCCSRQNQLCRGFALLLLLNVVRGLELTTETWDDVVSGKSVFVKFYAPWCAHCKKIKPDWDRLMEDFVGNDLALIADVDCVGSGKELCLDMGIKGYPTLRYGDPNDLMEYKGSKTYDDMKKFAEEKLRPQCGPATPDLCSDSQRTLIESFQTLSTGELIKRIKDKETQIEKLDSEHKEYVEKIKRQYEEITDKYNKEIEAVHQTGLGMMKKVKAYKDQVRKAAKDDL
mmetsp:Transcript_19144/g.42963  ORF Transcript_19144/g.42963 Transcript_19144/m.42963 type:complete len:231 (+) Transcript_19144:66-758(+)